MGVSKLLLFSEFRTPLTRQSKCHRALFCIVLFLISLWAEGNNSRLWNLTRQGSSADHVCIGEIQGCVQHEIGFYNLSSLLADVIKQTGTLQWDSAFIPKLEKKKNIR